MSSKIGHIDQIPGGKRFWKVGRAYMLRYAKTLYAFQLDLIESKKSFHRRRNIRWIDSSYMSVFNPLNNGNHINNKIDKNTVFILLRPPLYQTLLPHKEDKGLPSQLYFHYQIKVLCGEKTGWFAFPANVSPRTICKPII